jgi:hypothetical protein
VNFVEINGAHYGFWYLYTAGKKMMFSVVTVTALYSSLVNLRLHVLVMESYNADSLCDFYAGMLFYQLLRFASADAHQSFASS